MHASLAAIALALAGQATAQSFVKTNGAKFSLDGKDFFYAGTNAYYWPFSVWGTDHYTDVEVGMKAALDAGLKVARTWAFNDQNKTYNAAGLPQYGTGNEQTVFQRFNGDGTVTIDLSRLDVVIKAAETTGLKLILALTNNWADYGGMDVYTVNLGGRYHDDFYRLPAIKTAFKNYIRAVVTKYKSSPAIFAWEIANEARCGADGTRNLPRGPSCTPALITAWYEEISTFIKSLDTNHLVTTGSEGGFNRVSDDWTYNGADGADFDAEVKMKNIDFGTFHSYPDWWSKTPAWTEQWIKDHAAAGNGKPVVHEEYGWLKTNSVPRTQVVSRWQEVSLNLGMSDMYWQFGSAKYSYGKNYDDGFTIFLEDAEAKPLVYDHAAAVNAKNGGSTPPPPTTTSRPATLTTRTSTQAPPTSTAGGQTQVRYGQCGGINWGGPTQCATPYVCNKVNDWYSQCV